MLVMNFGCSPHFKQRGEVGFWRSCFSMPHRMSGRPSRQVKKRRHYWAVSVPLAASRSQYRFSRDQDGRIQSNGVSAAPCLPAEAQEPSASRNAGKAWSGKGVALFHSKSYRLPVHSISSIQEEFFSERKPCSGCRVIVSVIGTKTPSYRPLRGPFALGPFL